MSAFAFALALVASVGVVMIAVSERASRSPSALVQDDALWTPRGYGYRSQGYGEPYPAWAPGAYPILPTQEAAALAYAPEFVPYLRYKEYLENVLDAKLEAKRSERDALASQAYQAAADAARERQAWLDDFEAEKKVRQREVWEKHLAGTAGAGVFKAPAHSQQLFSVKDLMDAGDSEAEAMMDPSHPDGAWGHWVDGPRPYSDDAAAPRKAARSTRHLQGSPAWARVRARKAAQHIKKHVPPAQRAGRMAERTDAHGFTKGLPSAAHMFKQSLASVDLGEESNSEALMDPSHPSGPWGTWVEPSTSARSVIGEQQYEKYVGGTGYKSAMGSLLDTSAAKATKQILAGVDLGSESYAEALMDPSHPSGPWGTWVEPSTSARSVNDEQQQQHGPHVSGLYGVDNNTKQRIEAGQQAIAAAVAKSGLNGFGLEPKAGLGGRYGGVHGGDMADSTETKEMGRLLDSSP
jgi:hypothetical protein